MVSKTEIYKIKFTKECREEIRRIYEYISNTLVADKAAKNLMEKIRNTILKLEKTPMIYSKIDGTSSIKRCFRKIVINNYIILYLIDESDKIVYISHMYYGGRNYLDLF